MFRLLKPRQCIFVGPWCPIGSRWPCSRILSAHSLAATPVSTPSSRALLNSRRIWKFVIVDELKFDTDSPRGSFAYTRLIRVPDWNASVASVQLCKDLVHQLHLRFIHYVQVKQNPKGQSKLANGVASQAVVKMEGEGEHWDWGLRFNSL
mgnify:CR=1 FL=1